MNDMKLMVEHLGTKLKTTIQERIVNRLKELNGKITKSGKPYKVDYLNELLAMSNSINYKSLLLELIVRLRETSNSNLVTIHTFANTSLPREIANIPLTNKITRLGQWVGIVISALIDMKVLIVVKQAIEPKNQNEHHSLMDGFYINSHLLQKEYNCNLIREPNSKPKLTHRVLGSIWVKNGDELDHNDTIINLLNNTPLQFNQDVMAKLNYEFNLSEPDKKDWDSVKFPVYEDWIKARERAHEAYICKLPAYIKECTGTVYNTYAPDSRGRLYPTNDTGNMVGLKYIRAVIQSAHSDQIKIEEDE